MKTYQRVLAQAGIAYSDYVSARRRVEKEQRLAEIAERKGKSCQKQLSDMQRAKQKLHNKKEIYLVAMKELDSCRERLFTLHEQLSYMPGFDEKHCKREAGSGAPRLN